MINTSVEIVALLVKQMRMEDRLAVFAELFCSMIEANDFDVGLAMYEKRYQLESDPIRKQGQAGLIEFMREINTLRPWAIKLANLAKENLKKMEEGR